MIILIPLDQIIDWQTFHTVFHQTLGFPDFYGRNMNAWIDCMTYIDDSSAGMSTITVQPGQVLILQIEDPFNFKSRCPDQYDALIESTAFVNYRRTEVAACPVSDI